MRMRGWELWEGFALAGVSREREGSGQEAGQGWGSGEGLSPKRDRRYRAPEHLSGGGVGAKDELREQDHEGQGMGWAVQWSYVPQLSVTLCAEDGQDREWLEEAVRLSTHWLGLGGGWEKW